jgi:hypothetical protein
LTENFQPKSNLVDRAIVIVHGLRAYDDGGLDPRDRDALFDNLENLLKLVDMDLDHAIDQMEGDPESVLAGLVAAGKITAEECVIPPKYGIGGQGRKTTLYELVRHV